ncbi:SpoIID/LytB domain-containing protein [Quadrisphaera sp. GCM10027208]|uniref:SpoIID/LytB domain-containing protein n=1 Tax=Quadrisphaera sp. GCM10027208 TaxID=3273423 RepID=UPI00361E6FFA
MSQWGAYGAADAGLTYDRILDFYYPGTYAKTIADSPIRVWISTDNDADVRVDPAPGLAILSGDARYLLPTGDRYDGWRVVRGPDHLVVESLDGGVWTSWQPQDVTTPWDEDVRFTATDTFRLVLPPSTADPQGRRQELRGVLHAVPQGTSVLHSVLVLPMDTYLRGVVPAEMPAGWPAHALRAQSVAARTYAARLRAGSSTRFYDTCDTVSCQVFKGIATYGSDGRLIQSHEHPRTNDAIAATAGVVRYYRTSSGSEQLVLTEFSASNGGWTAGGPSSHPYQVAKRDPYDGRIPSSAHSWTATVPVATIQRNLDARYPQVGSLRQITVQTRTGEGDLGGRIVQAAVTGSRGSVVVSGATLRSLLGTKSDWFVITGPAPFPRDFSGDGAADLMAIAENGRFYLYPGDGTGGFGSRRQIGHGWGTRNLVTQAGDWDGDGAHDVIAREPVSGNLWLYRGDGQGGFASGAAIGGNWRVINAFVGPGDWTGDGEPDLLARRRDDATLWVYTSDGSGRFTGQARIGRGWSGMDLLRAVGDVTGDGVPDIVARRMSTGELVLYPGDGRGGFGTSRVLTVDVRHLVDVSSPGDWDGDSYPDLLGRDAAGRLFLFAGTENGDFSPGRQVGSGWSGYSFVG